MEVPVVAEERYWYPHDGGVVWVAGFALVDDDGRFVGRDAPEVAGRGLVVCHVAGAREHHGEALDSEGSAPGCPLRLRRDPANPHDASAIAVDLWHSGARPPTATEWHSGARPPSATEWHSGARPPSATQLGWVPRELAARLAPQLDAGKPWSAVVLRERRDSPRDPRTGVSMLLAPAERIELRSRG